MGHVEVVRWLLTQGVPDTEVGNSLECSAGHGHKPVVQALLKHMADIDTYGPLALAAAVGNGHLEVALLLLEAGTPHEKDVGAHAARLLAVHLMGQSLMQGPSSVAATHDTVVRFVEAFSQCCDLDFAELAEGAAALMQEWFTEPKLFLAEAKAAWVCTA
jgi:hypothetical protein